MYENTIKIKTSSKKFLEVKAHLLTKKEKKIQVPSPCHNGTV